ncbi:hypothetical protein GCM10009858_05810 [Terrabacter carboxydivorans]|uniref:Glycosyl hydrolase family 32 N-terminal domain-containing protein n=1 Tax=Terrabacter carboxydivorans TaxID=619730 RepID=A0ABP5Y4A5_9MICO
MHVGVVYALAFEELATWTGSVVRHPDGRWFMFYTGARLNEVGANVQSIGYAVSTDLMTWDKAPGPVLSADPRWYEKHADGHWHDEAFRDPWVLPDPDGDGWHMLITARANHRDVVDRGVVGHAWSADLETWELREPLSSPGQGFGQLEVQQPFVVDGRDVLLFNSMIGDMSEAARAEGVTGGVWIADAKSPLGPYNIAGAQVIDEPSLYVGKFVTERESGETKLLAFVHDRDGSFVGEITDPYAVSWEGDRLALTPSRS